MSYLHHQYYFLLDPVPRPISRSTAHGDPGIVPCLLPQKLAISPSGDLRQPILPETVERNISVRLCCCIPRGKVSTRMWITE